MAGSWGKAEYDELRHFRDMLQELDNKKRDEFFRIASKELAARLLGEVIPLTPIGNYDIIVSNSGKILYDPGKNGGTLRRGWTGGVDMDARTYAQSLPITKSGNTYTIEVINPIEYASYVEFGHRQTPGRFVPAIGKRLKSSFVPGKYMLTKSEALIQAEIPGFLEKRLYDFLKSLTEG